MKKINKKIYVAGLMAISIISMVLVLYISIPVQTVSAGWITSNLLGGGFVNDDILGIDPKHNPAPATIACSNNTQCGSNGITGSPFCQGNSVYQNVTTYICNNPGTTSSSCTNSAVAQLQTACSGSQTCANGSCANVACTTNSQCGTNALTGSLFCQGNNVYQNYTTYTCNSPGTASSSCTNSVAAQLQTTCSASQTCSAGACVNNAPACTVNYQQRCSGSNLYWYDSCGTQGNLIQYCPNGCSGNACIATQNCTLNYQERCLGSNLYWYDSCGTQGSLVQYCPNGCSGNACTYNYVPTCTQNYQERCSGNALYWYDSCGNQQNLVQYCPNGCSGNSCTYNNNASLTVSETVKNLTAGTGFSTSVVANPSDMLLYMITLQASNQDVQNVFVRDTLPANIIYNNQLIVACTGNNYNCNNNSNGNIVSGVNLNTIYAGQTVTITFQAQAAGTNNFAYGTSTLNDSVSITGSQLSYLPTASTSVTVTKGQVLGASTVSTGLTNNFWVDSFFLPLLITLILIWMWRSGLFFGAEKWLDSKRKNLRTYKAEKELSKRISTLKKS